jgi:hypothetical protein
MLPILVIAAVHFIAAWRVRAFRIEHGWGPESPLVTLSAALEWPVGLLGLRGETEICQMVINALLIGMLIWVPLWLTRKYVASRRSHNSFRGLRQGESRDRKVNRDK